jgi:hypothetical protein
MQGDLNNQPLATVEKDYYNAFEEGSGFGKLPVELITQVCEEVSKGKDPIENAKNAALLGRVCTLTRDISLQSKSIQQAMQEGRQAFQNFERKTLVSDALGLHVYNYFGKLIRVIKLEETTERVLFGRLHHI